MLSLSPDGRDLLLPALTTAHSHAFQRAMRGAAQRPARAAFFAILPVVIAIPLVEQVIAPNDFGVGYGSVFITVGFTLLAALFGALLILVVSAEPGSRLHRAFSSKFLRTFGKYSYGVYLFHLPIRALIRDRIFGPANREARIHFPRLLGSELPGQLLFYLVAGAAALGVAWVSFQVFEKQFLKLKRAFPSGAAPRATPHP